MDNNSGGVTASLDQEATNNNNNNNDARSDPYLEIELYLKKVNVSENRIFYSHPLAAPKVNLLFSWKNHSFVWILLFFKFPLRAPFTLRCPWRFSLHAWFASDLCKLRWPENQFRQRRKQNERVRVLLMKNMAC